LQLAANSIEKQAIPANPYGDGFAGRRIADALLRD